MQRPLGLLAASAAGFALSAQVSFGPMHYISEAYAEPRAPALHDMDHDGDLDILTVSGDSGLVWHRNDGGGDFSGTLVIDPDVYPPWNMHTGPLLLDVDNDGDDDIICAKEEEVSWWPDNGSGDFGPAALLFTAALADLHAARMDEDALIDLVGMSQVGGMASWFRNDGQGGFIEHELGAGNPSWVGECADVDSDGRMDFVRADSVYLHWYRNTGGGVFDALQWLAEAPHGQGSYGLLGFKFGDLDADGDQDLITQDTGLPYEPSVLTNDGDENFAFAQSLGVFPVLGPLLHDLDDDGDTDLVFSHADIIGWHPNDGLGHLGPRDTMALVPPGYIGNDFSSVAMGDINGDGQEDVVATFQRYMPPPQNMSLVWIPVFADPALAPSLAASASWLPQVLPQPVEELATLVFPSPLERGTTARLVDAHGRLVRQWTLGPGRVFPVQRAGLAAGVYTLQLALPDGRAGGVKLLMR